MTARRSLPGVGVVVVPALTGILTFVLADRTEAAVPRPPQPKVAEARHIPGTLDLGKWRTTGPVIFGPSEKIAPGTQAKALRVEVPQTHEARKKRSFTGEIFTLAQAEDWSRYNRFVVCVYVEPSKTPRGGAICAHLYAEDGIRRPTGPYVVRRGKWTEVVWDITPVPRRGVSKFMFTQGVHRHSPGESDRNVFHLGRVELRRVEPPTKYRGWELQPHRVAFSHVGYTPAGEKTAIFPGGVGETVRLLDAKTRRAVWRGKLQPVSHPRTGRFKLADFSEWRREGRYVLTADGPNGPLATDPFPIKRAVHGDVIRRVFDFYRAERCGDSAPGYHTACHLDDGRVEPYSGMKPQNFAPEVRAIFGTHVDCCGGWHDAGDQAKFAYQEYNSAVQMFRLYERGLRYRRPGEARDAVLDEAIWGVKYALKTLLPTGRHCDRPERVGVGVWTDNVPVNDDDRQVGMTTWRCAERYVAGLMTEAIAARVLKEVDPELAMRCLQQAELEAEAYLTGATKDWRSAGWLPLRYASVGLAFLELYRTSGKDRYADEAARCGDELVACQEQSLAWNDQGITGFWYEGPKRKRPFAHGSGDGGHAYLLVELCREFPDHASWMKWYAALRIYATFYAQATSAYLTPYGIPAFSLHGGPDARYEYWDCVRAFGQAKRQKLDFQFERLVRVGKLYLVRIRNCNSALNTSAMTLAGVAALARDPQAEHLAQRCFQWMVGRNPFSRSQIWDVGYRFREQPHYVASHDEMPGSLACKGIDGRLDGDSKYHDEPFSDPLPRCVINEVCIAQSQHLLNAGCELAFSPRLAGTVRGERRPNEVLARFAGTDQIAARSSIGSKGAYALLLPGGGTYDIEYGSVRRRQFVATATQCRSFDLDLERELAVSVECPKTVKPGSAFDLRVHLRRLAASTSCARVALSLRTHNVECAEPTKVVKLTDDEERVTFRLTPQRAAEPFIVLVVPDNQLCKRAEAMGVVHRQR